MTLKALARSARESLQAQTGCHIRHSHIHELLAAAFGFTTWAALCAEALLADQGVGTGAQATAEPHIAGRALQLRYDQAQAVAMAGALLALIRNQNVGLVRWSTLAPLLPVNPPSSAVAEDGDLDADEDVDGGTDELDGARSTAMEPATALREHLLTSGLLLDSLEAAAIKQPYAHHVLAAILRCSKPNPYLYEEAQKGRELTAAERIWVAEYLQLAPRYQRYEAHLKAAAQAGVRAAALEYGIAFEQPGFIALAERLDGSVDAEHMARFATTQEARLQWLRQAAEEGSQWALEELADFGDAWAEERFARRAGAHWLRIAAERALAENDAVRAWTWQYVALARGEDLTRSTLAARHDGGEKDNEFYDSDFGGPLYVDGDEGLALPDLDPAGRREARTNALRIARS